MVDTAVAVDVVRAAMCEYRKSFPDKEKTTVSDQVLILSTLEAIEAKGMAVVDGARIERLLNVVGPAMQLAAEPSGSLMASARLGHLRRAIDEIQPGDLDPIP